MAAASLKKRLSGYWQLEAANVLLVPGIFLFLTGWNPSWITLVSFAPMIVLLAIGAFYWRAKLQRLKDRAYPFQSAMRIISYCQAPALILSVAGAAIVAFGWIERGQFTSGWDQTVATGAAVLAVLEYVNYYHRQLQHFDHVPDFKRLLAGKGLRPSQMARDLKDYRRT